MVQSLVLVAMYTIKPTNMKMNLRDLDWRYVRRSPGLSPQQRKTLMVAGISIGIAALLTYPAILLYRRMENKQKADGNAKALAPGYRGNHKPLQRMAEANGQAHS